MNKIKFLILILVLILSGCEKKNDEKNLSLYSYGDYVNQEILDIYYKETGIKVNCDTFATSEDAYIKIKNGGINYDLIIASDYIIERMIKGNLLQELDFSEIKNFDLIDDRFKNLDFDFENKYSVPYAWGTVGILFNKKVIKKNNLSWNILWDEKYKNKIFMYDNARDNIAITLKKLGYSVNTCDDKKLEEAKKELIKQKKIIQAYLSDAIKDKMINDEALLALCYSGDALFCCKGNKNLDYVIPDEGSNFWIDGIGILKCSGKKKEASKFINFLCREDIGLLNTEHICHSTVNKKVLEALPDEIKKNKIYWPSEKDFKRCEIYHDLGDVLKKYDVIWTEVLAED